MKTQVMKTSNSFYSKIKRLWESLLWECSGGYHFWSWHFQENFPISERRSHSSKIFNKNKGSLMWKEFGVFINPTVLKESKQKGKIRDVLKGVSEDFDIMNINENMRRLIRRTRGHLKQKLWDFLENMHKEQDIFHFWSMWQLCVS